MDGVVTESNEQVDHYIRTVAQHCSCPLTPTNPARTPSTVLVHDRHSQGIRNRITYIGFLL
jgi:hypothetical protein